MLKLNSRTKTLIMAMGAAAELSYNIADHKTFVYTGYNIEELH